MRTGQRMHPLELRAESWMADAACRGMDPNIFHPLRGQDAARAKRVCATCSVVAQCGDYAERAGEHLGVWGGTSEHERKKMRRRLSIVAAPLSGDVA